jgi:integrase
MASIRERVDADGKKTFQAQVRIKGYPPQTRTFATKTDAKRWSHQTEVDIRSGMHIRQTQSTTRTVADLIDEYEKIVLPGKKQDADASKATFEFWRKHLGDYALSAVTPKLIEEKRDRLAREETHHKKPRAPATVLRYMMLLSHAFSTAVNWQWCERNPVEAANKPKVNNRRVRYLNDDERERLFTECRASENLDIYLVVVLAMSTGMRKGEIMGMRWEAVTFHEERGFAKLLLSAEDTKNSTQRSVFIASLAYQLLHRRRAALTTRETTKTLTGLVFPSSINPKNPVDLRKPWETALTRAEITDFRFHDLRHTAASYMAMNGATTLEIKEALGHKSTAMAERYSHLSQSHVDDVVLKMNERHFGKKGLADSVATSSGGEAT